MNWPKLTAFFAMLMVLASLNCAKGPAFTLPAQPPKDQAMVLIFREHRFVGAAGYPIISVNGQQAVALKSGGYCVYTSAPGPLVFTAPGFGETLQISVEAGKTYFVEWKIGGKMESQSFDEAMDILQGCKELECIKK